LAAITSGSSGERRRRAAACRPALPLSALDQVIAAAEALTAARQQQHVHGRIEIGALDQALEIADQLPVDPVAALRAIERQAGDPAGHLVGDCAHAGVMRRPPAPDR
jgi:hypothetical protein